AITKKAILTKPFPRAVQKRTVPSASSARLSARPARPFLADALSLPTTTAITSTLNLCHPDRLCGSLGDRGPRRHPLLVRRGGAEEERRAPDTVRFTMLHQGISTRLKPLALLFRSC